MQKLCAASAAVVLLASAAAAKTGVEPPNHPTWDQGYASGPYAEPGRRHFRKTGIHFARHRRRPDEPAPRRPAARPPDATVDRLQREISDLRAELEAVKARVRSPWSGAPFWPATLAAPLAEAVQRPSLPDLRLPWQLPSLPVPAPAPAEDGQAAVDRARAYLAATATPGYTMERQGVAVAIGRLHPEFALRLADAVRECRQKGLPHVGVFSAYRPPAFGVGGFLDKFFSMHSYGLAADMAGIGAPGSAMAAKWEGCVRDAGLRLPYGTDNRSEFNHTQLIGAKKAWAAMRRTISSEKPKDLRAMWLASGVQSHVPEEKPANPSASLLPDVDWRP